MNRNLRLRVLPQIPPVNGKEIELRTTDDFIQWRYVNWPFPPEDWANLIALSDLIGPEGPAIEMRVDDGFVQYAVEGTGNWIDLVPLSDLEGPEGPPGPEGPSVAPGGKKDIVVVSAGTDWRRAREFSTVAALLSDDGSGPTGMGYAGSGAPVIVDPGDIVTAQGFRYEVLADDAVDWSVQTDGGVRLLAIADVLQPEMFGALSGTSGDQSAAFQRMADHPSKTWRLTGYYRVDQIITCNHDLIIDGSGTFDGAVSGAGQLLCEGSATQIAGLNADVSRGARAITLSSAPALSPGDLILLCDPNANSWSPQRDYRKGEFLEVRSVSGSTINIYGYLRDGYLAANAQVYKINPISVTVRDVSFIESAATSRPPLKVKWGRNIHVENVKAKSQTYTGLEFDRCYGLTIIGGSSLNMSPWVNDEYAITISSCTNFTILGARNGASRHAIALGAYGDPTSIPVRDGKIIGCILTNAYHSTTGGAAGDMHGNCDEIVYDNCTFLGGVTMNGRNPTVRNSTIYPLNVDAYGACCVYSSEPHSGTFTIENCLTISPFGLANAYGPISLNPGDDTAGPILLVVRNVTSIVDTGHSSGCMIRLQSRNCAHALDLVADGLIFKTPETLGIVLANDTVKPALLSNFLSVTNAQIVAPAGLRRGIHPGATITAVPTNENGTKGTGGGTTIAWP